MATDSPSETPGQESIQPTSNETPGQEPAPPAAQDPRSASNDIATLEGILATLQEGQQQVMAPLARNQEDRAALRVQMGQLQAPMRNNVATFSSELSLVEEEIRSLDGWIAAYSGPMQALARSNRYDNSSRDSMLESLRAGRQAVMDLRQQVLEHRDVVAGYLEEANREQSALGAAMEDIRVNDDLIAAPSTAMQSRATTVAALIGELANLHDLIVGEGGELDESEDGGGEEEG